MELIPLQPLLRVVWNLTFGMNERILPHPVYDMLGHSRGLCRKYTIHFGWHIFLSIIPFLLFSRRLRAETDKANMPSLVGPACLLVGVSGLH